MSTTENIVEKSSCSFFSDSPLKNLVVWYFTSMTCWTPCRNQFSDLTTKLAKTELFGHFFAPPCLKTVFIYSLILSINLFIYFYSVIHSLITQLIRMSIAQRIELRGIPNDCTLVDCAIISRCPGSSPSSPFGLFCESQRGDAPANRFSRNAIVTSSSRLHSR